MAGPAALVGLDYLNGLKIDDDDLGLAEFGIAPNPA